MGYGEFGGGGSVAWRVHCPAGDDTAGYKHPAKEPPGKKQREGKADDGSQDTPLVVVVTNGTVLEQGKGRVVVSVPIAQFKTDQAQVMWGKDADDLLKSLALNRA
jgi:hypothetical protein